MIRRLINVFIEQITQRKMILSQLRSRLPIAQRFNFILFFWLCEHKYKATSALVLNAKYTNWLFVVNTTYKCLVY